jgi:hydroxymethylpyrimidine pyrophosphatase-like HAD family hydrolase
VYNRTIPYQIAKPLLVACDKYGIKTASELSGMHYSNFNVSAEWPIITNYEIVDFSKHDIDAEKLYMIVSNPKEVKLIQKYLDDALYLTLSRDGLGQVMHKEATKSKAIAALAEKWNITNSEIVAFGDDLNDIDMLVYAGIGVAMGNAVGEVKSIADYECLTNDEDGVSEWLAKHLL